MDDLIYLKQVESLPGLIRGNVKIEWVNLGEGLNGDYDPQNPDDRNLLRFDVYRCDDNGWAAIEDGSYCTMVDANSKYSVLRDHLRRFMDIIYDDVSNHGKAKRLCESLSWTS
jgi:gamma-glutamyl:cysteine ligase YbdK (ATP-grasp superfamily)